MGLYFKHCNVPFDGLPLRTFTNDEEYEYYITWLADYLYELKAAAPRNQEGLCRWLDSNKTTPLDTLYKLGKLAGVYQLVVVQSGYSDTFESI